MRSKPIPLSRTTLRPETEELERVAAARAAIDRSQEGRLAELLRAWGPGELTVLCKALSVLRDGHSRTAGALRNLDLSPRPQFLVGQLQYEDAAIKALGHAIACILECCPTADQPHFTEDLRCQIPGKPPRTF